MKNKNKEPIKYTKEELKIIKEKNKIINLFTGIIVGMFICITAYLIINLLKLSKIETIIRYSVILLLIILLLVILKKYLKLRKQPKKSKYILFIVLLLIFGTVEFMLSNIIDKGVSTIDKISKNKITYTSSLISMKDGDFTTKGSISKAKIGIISDENDVEGYVLAKNIIKNNKIDDEQLVEYDDYITMLSDLYENEVNAIFISGSYVDKFSPVEKFANIKDDVIMLDKYSKLMKKVVDKTTKASSKSVTEPFTLLLLGVDSEEEDISKTSGLGDSIMLVTFNPTTLNATIFSIPRDTYVPISCYRNALSKITHAASGGDSCMIKTVENFTGIDIDYYAKMNFKGLVNLVDLLGGIDVDVPYSFCESNSSRSLVDLVYVNKGWQHLNGEQALALSRNRKTLRECGKEWNQGTRNDFVRGQNQQLVVKATMNKAKSIKSINQVYEILDTISMSLDTNLTREQILDFYNVFKKILLSSSSLSDNNDIISMQKTYLNGSGGMIFDNIMGMDLYEFVPSSQSLNAIIKAMKVNLGLEKEEYDTSFSFTIDEEYEPKVIGSDLYGGVKKYPSSSSSTEEIPDNKESTDNCSTNEELGADGVSCVCKSGYKRDSSGNCIKQKQCTGTYEMAEPLSDGSCGCINGYKKKNGVCTKEETSDSNSGSSGNTTNPSGNGESKDPSNNPPTGSDDKQDQSGSNNGSSSEGGSNGTNTPPDDSTAVSGNN